MTQDVKDIILLLVVCMASIVYTQVPSETNPVPIDIEPIDTPVEPLDQIEIVHGITKRLFPDVEGSGDADERAVADTSKDEPTKASTATAEGTEPTEERTPEETPSLMPTRLSPQDLELDGPLVRLLEYVWFRSNIPVSVLRRITHNVGHERSKSNQDKQSPEEKSDENEHSENSERSNDESRSLEDSSDEGRSRNHEKKTSDSTNEISEEKSDESAISKDSQNESRNIESESSATDEDVSNESRDGRRRWISMWVKKLLAKERMLFKRKI